MPCYTTVEQLYESAPYLSAVSGGTLEAHPGAGDNLKALRQVLSSGTQVFEVYSVEPEEGDEEAGGPEELEEPLPDAADDDVPEPPLPQAENSRKPKRSTVPAKSCGDS